MRYQDLIKSIKPFTGQDKPVNKLAESVKTDLRESFYTDSLIKSIIEKYNPKITNTDIDTARQIALSKVLVLKDYLVELKESYTNDTILINHLLFEIDNKKILIRKSHINGLSDNDIISIDSLKNKIKEEK